MNAHRFLIAACALGISAFAASGLVGSATAYEQNTDRPGGDYRNFEIGAKLQNYTDACERACSSDSRCRAYTVVKPGFQGANARCWLKSVVPAAVPSNCCTSRVMPGRTAPSVVLTCAQEPEERSVMAEMRIVNQGPGAVPVGAAIIYRLSTGETGTVTAPGGIAPGSFDLHDLNPRRVEPAFTCTATLR